MFSPTGMDVLNHTENPEIARFLERLVHDLREPLRSIGAFTEVLAETARNRVGGDGERALREIPEGIARIGVMLEGLSGYALALREPVDCGSPASMQSAFRIVLAEMDMPIRDCGAAVTAVDLPTLNLSLDRLMQLLRILIGNSLRFRSEAAPAIRVSAAMEQSGWWTLRVEDNGIGIPPEECSKVFTPFTRLHGRKYGGIGLGLATAKRIVEAHGGSIRMEPAPGGGCICVFTLPEI